MAVALLGCAAAGVLAACGADASTATPTATRAATNNGVRLGVPDVAISLYQGEGDIGDSEVTLSDVVGIGKPVVLNFYAALCPPCRAEMPEFQHAYEERGDEVTFLSLDIGPQFFLGTREEGAALLKELDVHYPAGTTFDENIVRRYQVTGMPTTVFLRADGSMMRAWSGALTGEKLNKLIGELLEES